MKLTPLLIYSAIMIVCCSFFMFVELYNHDTGFAGWLCAAGAFATLAGWELERINNENI